ncbi:BLOC-1-related complex subunit 8-like [Tachypleus tridentatus]|uniref:BLOC-1-related complex subunit 8-like n=1 Tax=Tachypleus tridentatus TaxID=6853 RepID=UPI003FD5DB48
MPTIVPETGLYVAKDLVLEHEVKKTCEKISENLHIIANEPSLACYRLQEHIHKSLPQMVEIRQEVNQVNEDLHGKCFDLDYSVSAVNSMHGSLQHFQNTFELLRNCMFMKQQLNFKESSGTEKKTLKVQHFSGSFDHNSSVLPNLPTGLTYSASADDPCQKPQVSQH